MRVNHQHETNNLASNSGLFGCALSAQNCAPISPEKNAKLQVVDENALIAALQKGEIHAAGLDVFEQEPLSVDSPLLSMANVVAVPHIGSATHETRYGMAACAVDNLIDALQGKVEKNCVNPHVAD